jgi:hypothetical protein
LAVGVGSAHCFCRLLPVLFLELDADRFEREWYPKVLEMMTPYLTHKPIVRYYELETSPQGIRAHRRGLSSET